MEVPRAMEIPTPYIRVVPAFPPLLFVCAVLATPCDAYAQAAASHSVVFDSYMTPAAGAEGVLTLQHVLTTVEDRWLPIKLGDERSRPALALGILYRSGQFFAL